jgi:RNA polymerase sigma-70 factor (ECF subfamily)
MEKSFVLEPPDIAPPTKVGSSDAFTIVVEEFQSAIVNYLYRLTGDRELARDLAQDTFVRAYEARRTTLLTGSLRAWLYRIATNCALQYLRRRARIPLVPLDDTLPDRSGTSNPGNSGAAAVHEALLGVSERQRVCMILHFVDGFKHREIAAMLGISEDAVRMRVARGCSEFRRLFRCPGEELS